MCEALPPTHKKGIHITKFRRYMEGRTEVFPVGARRIVFYLRPICLWAIAMLKRAS